METNQENVIEINHLVKKYKMYHRKKDRLLEVIFPKLQRHTEFTAVNDLNLTVKKGEVVGILGKNGAGKSTLLKMITGVVVPTSGDIKVNGKISSLLELGTAFNSELTGEENIYQHGQVMGLTMEEIEKSKQSIIDFADIGEHLYQPVKTYSSGMFARLAFSCAINVNPEILIVDEVLSVGDMAFQLKCFKKFEEFKKSGKTIFFVTHSINDVIRNCTRTIIMKEGAKVFDGGVKEGTELYKKMIVGLDEIEEPKQDTEIISYGNGKAEITEYKILDQKDEEVKMFDNDEEVRIKFKVKFKEDIEEPIFAVSVKDFKGLEILGTNTDVEKIPTGNYKAGDEITVEYKQKIPKKGCVIIDNKGAKDTI